MRKILLLLLTLGFFAKPILAQDGTASASVRYICPGSDVFLYYSGSIPNSVWEFLSPFDETGTWQSFAPADQPVNPLGLVNMPVYIETPYWFRVKSPDGDSYVYSNQIYLLYGQAWLYPTSGIEGDLYKCDGDNSVSTLTLSSGGVDPYTNIHWSTGETTNSINVNPASTTEYSVTSTDGEGCVTTATFTITVQPLIPPLIQTTSSGSVCSGAPVTLSFGGFSTASPCTLSPNGQNPAAAITPVPDGSQTEVTTNGHLGEYSIINVEQGKYYSFFTREISGGGVGTENWYSTITSADGSQVYTSGLYGQAIWTATYTGQARFYSNNINCVTNNAILLHRFLQCFTDPPASFLWMPGGQTTPSITVNPGSTTNYTLTVSNVSTLQFNSCPGSATKQVTVIPCSTLSATCSSNNPELYFGYSGDQTSTITATPSGGVAPYTVSIKMNRPLKCNQVNDAGDEVWTGGIGGSTINNGCPIYPGLATLPPVSSKNISSGSYAVTVTLMDDADIITTVTDASGATYSCTTHVHGEDVRCFAGKSGVTKVTLCHKTGSSKNPCITMCVDESDVAAHIAHGDFLGKCTADCNPPRTSSNSSFSISIANPANNIKTLKLYPNPTKGQFVVELNIPEKINANAKIQLIEMTGKTVQTENAQINSGALQKTINVSSVLTKGIYMVRIVVNDKVYKTQLVYDK
jgi:hypothetical protein